MDLHGYIQRGLIPKFWRERITSKNRQRYPTIFPIYFTSIGDEVTSLTGESAPRSLAQAERIADHVIKDQNNAYTHALIYKQEAIMRVGCTFETPRKDRV